MKKLLIFFLLISCIAEGQNLPVVITTPTQYKELVAPQIGFNIDTLPPPSHFNMRSTRSWLAFKNGTLYAWDPAQLKYVPAGSGGVLGVTSIGIAATGALASTGGPITSSGTITLGWTGTADQYVRGNGTLSTFTAEVQEVADARYAPAEIVDEIIDYTFSSPLYKTVGNNINIHYEYPTYNARWLQTIPITANQPCNGCFLGFDSTNIILKYMRADSALGIGSLFGKAGGDNNMGENRVAHFHNTRTFELDSVNALTLGRSGIARVFYNSASTALYSPDGTNSVQVSDAVTTMSFNNSANYFELYQDSAISRKKISYPWNIHGTFGPYSHVDRSWVDSVLAASGDPYTLPTASTTVLGGVKIDGTTITISSGVISAAAGSGEANTGSNLGGGLANYSTKVGLDLRFNSFAAADFDLGSNLITIDATKWLTISSAASTYQPLDGDLTAIGAIAGTAGYLKKTAADTWSLDNSTFLTTETDPIAQAPIQFQGGGSNLGVARTVTTVNFTGNVTASRATNTVTVNVPAEVDASVTNELQTIANTSNATTHTATLSNSGGSLQLVEGSNITLTTTGTGLNGIVTIATSGIGEANTASTLGGGLANYSTKVGVDLQFNSFAAADFDLASNLITIDGTKWLTISAADATYQPLDADLTTISGLTATTNNFIVGVSSAWASVTPASARTALGGTTVGQNIYTATNPSAIRWIRVNADNTITFRTAAETATDIGAITANQTITLSGDVTGSGATAITTTIANDAVTYAKMQNISATNRIMGRITAAAGDMEELTGTQTTTLLDVFTTSLKGLAPSSGGGTTNFLRADGTWATPTGSGTVTTVSVVSANGLAGSVATATTTPAITLSTTITGILKGNGTAISAAVSGTDLKTVNGASIIGSGDIPTLANPMTTLGDIIYGGASGATTRLAGAAGFLKSTGAAAPTFSAIAESDVTNLVTDLSNKQPLDADLTTIAGLTATTDNFIVSVASAWASRTVAQVKTTLGLTGTNSGDQTITLTGDVTGSGSGSFATTVTTQMSLTRDASGIKLVSDEATPTDGKFYGKVGGVKGWFTPSGGGANSLGTYIVQTATNAPANAQVLGSLGTGLVKNTTTTGVLSIAVAGTDYVATETDPLSIHLTGTSTLTGNATVATGANTLTVITSTAAVNPLSVSGTTGTGIAIATTTGLPVNVTKNSTTTTGIEAMLNITRNTSGTAANGIASALDFYTEASDGGTPNATRFLSTVTNVTPASFTSTFSISVQNSNALTERFLLYGNGDLTLSGYPNSRNDGAVASGSTKLVYVDANGKLQVGTATFGTGTGTGTVTDITIGNLSPLFTSSVATSTTTPAITFALTNAAAKTVFGNFTNSSGAPSYNAASAADQVLVVNGANTALTFGTVATGGITNAAVTLAKMADVATATVFYRKTAGTGAPEVQTLATLKTDLGLTGTNAGDQNLFSNIPVSGQTTVTANSTTTALTLVAGTNMTITTDNTAKSVTFAATGSGANSLGTYIVQTATNAPANAQILGSLATGLVKNTTTTGVLSIAVSGTDVKTINGTSILGSGDITTVGFANPMTTTGDIIYGAASGVATRLAGSAGFLKSTGAAAPAWSAIAESDVTNLTTDLAAKQVNIQFQDEGTNLGTSGTATVVNFVGANVTSTRATNTVTVTIAGGGGGTVTDFSAGDLSPLFTTTEATTTSTPALSFALTNAAAKTVFGNFTNSSAAPSYNAASAADQVLVVNTGNTALTFGTIATGGITNGAVTLAKMADVATATVFYRKTAGTGAPEVQTLSTLKTDLGLTGTNAGDQNLFSNIPVSGQTTVTANSTTTALTLVAGTGMTITTDNTAKSITFASSGGGGGFANPMTTLGDIIYGGASGVATRLAGAAGFLKSTGAAAPTFSAIAESDVTSLVTDLSNKQPLDADLTTISGLTATTDNFIVSVSSSWASRTPAQVRTTLALVIGTNVQAYNANLTTWASVTPATGITSFLANPTSANLAAALTDEEDLTIFTNLADGLVPASGSLDGTTVLYNDGVWRVPSGGGGGANALGTYIVKTATNAPANAQILSSLSTGIVKVTTTTGVLSTAVAGDFPTLNQATTNSAGSISGTNVITNSNLSQMATNTIKGNNTGVTANALDLTATQATAMLNVFTTSLKGLVPSPGTVTGKVLSDNGTWIANGGSGTVNTGVAGYLAYYPSSSTTVDDQAHVFLDNSSGDLGLGTATPATVDGNALTTQHIFHNYSATESSRNVVSGTQASFDLVDIDASANSKWVVLNNSASKFYFKGLNDAGSTTFDFISLDLASGFVGIFNTTPAVPFDVSGVARFNTYKLQNEIAAPSTPTSGLGLWYVNSTDSKAHFISDGGVDYDLTAGGTTSPGGSDTYVQFNDASAFGGDAGMVYNKTTDELRLAGIADQGTYKLQVGGDAYISGYLSVNGAEEVKVDDINTADITWPVAIYHTTSGTPALGIGVGIFFNVETAASNIETGAELNIVSTDIGAATEDFDFVVKLMTNGANPGTAGGEKLRITSKGGLRMPEVTAPGTPVSGFAIMYVKADGLFYSKDDAGVETLMSGGSGGGGGGEINTASSLGGGLDIYSTKVGVDLRFNTLAAADFNLASNVITIDYTNGQAATNSQPGFLTAADHTSYGKVADQVSNFFYFTDFMNVVGVNGANEVSVGAVGTGAGSSIDETNLATNRMGIERQSTGTTTTGYCYVWGYGTTIVFGGGTWTYETSIYIPTAADATERYALVVGFWDAAAANQVDGAYLLYDFSGVSTGSAASANWQRVTASNTTRTFATSTTAVATGAWIKLKVVVNAAASSVDYFVNGTSIGTNTANIPTGATRNLGFGVSIIKSAGTTARVVDVDYMSATAAWTSPR